MKKSTKKWLVGSGVIATAAAGAAAAIRGLSKFMVGLAMDRKGPKEIEKSMRKVSGSRENRELEETFAKAKQALEENVEQTVEIESHDGLRLVGHWYPAENPKRILIAMHGWRSSWSRDFGVIAPFWHNNGCSVLFAEQRGQGESDGDYMGFGMLERHDCLKWAQWVNAQNPDDLPIYLTGVSMGATTVLMTGNMDLPANVRGIMADCGFTSAYDIWKHVAEENLHLHYGLYASAADDLCKKRIQMTSRECSTKDVLQECKVPVLFAHGTADSFVPVEMTYENYGACTSEKRLFIVPGAEHGMSYFVDPAGYEREMQAFWKENDEKDNGGD